MLSKILIGILLAFGAAGYFYYTTTQAKLEQQASLIVAFELKHKEQDRAINELQTNLIKQAENLNVLSAANAAAEAELNRYMDIFSRHDLTKLAAAKPGLIEPRINNGTNDVFKSLKESSTIIPADNNQ